MKRLIALILILMLLFTSCAKKNESTNNDSSDTTVNTETENNQPEGNQPEGNQPEGNQPEGNQPENPEHTHRYNGVVTEPTCDTNGYTTYTCLECDDSYKADFTSALGHNYTSSITAPTCVANGYTTYKCSVCDDSYISNILSALGHKYDAVITSPDGDKNGYTTYTCAVCDDYYVVEDTSHAHSYNAVVKAPTCESNGYTTYTCSSCGYSYVSNEVSATGHSYKSTVIAATCETAGYTTYTCAVCSDSYTGNTVAATGHSYKSTVIAATCETAGYTTYTCTACSDSYTGNTVAATGHSYKSTVIAATCETAGYTTYTCTVCSDSYKENTTAATGHSYKSSVTAATCETAGYTTYTCTVCSDSYKENTTAATGHSYKSSVTAATCETAGYTTYTCSVCSDSYTGNTVAATGHTNKTVSGYAATCNVSGLSDGVVCSVCNITITAQTTIDPLGHSWKAATTEAPKTCTTCGATEGDKLSTPSGYSDTLYVSYINVGQGDSILIQVGDCDILIDAGTSGYGTTVSNYLSGRGVDDIELMINTHPDSDHCGGLTKVLNDFVVEQVWISKDTSKTTAAYTNFISAVGTEGLTAKKPNAGTVFTYGYLNLTVLYSAVGSDANNSSIVVMLEYGSFKFLFTGDAGEEVEKKLLSSGQDLSCDVLKVGHHGSKTSSTASFLSATGADYGVICVGSNSYGHPTSEALTRLSSAGITVYRTDLNGNILFTTNGATLTLPGGTSVGGGSGSSSGSSSGGSSSGGSSSGSSSSTQIFIGNTESKVFHLPTCSSLPAASKQNTMYDYWWIINIAGYTPCGRCLKNYTPDSGSVSGTAYIANTDSKVYHLFTCSYLPAASKQTIIYNTSGYTPCGHCIKSSATSYIANKESKVYHLSTCSNLPAASKQEIIYDTTGYTPCGRCISKSSVNSAVNTSAKAYAYNTYALRFKITLY